MDALLEKYFAACSKEDIGRTIELTKQIDELEKAIREQHSVQSNVSKAIITKL